MEKFVIINQNLELEKREKLVEYVRFVISHYKKNFDKNLSKYRVLTIDELKSDTNITIEYNLKYEGKGNVYYVVSNNKVFTHIIFNEDQKIISFFSAISQASTNRTPIFLNTFDDFK